MSALLNVVATLGLLFVGGAAIVRPQIILGVRRRMSWGPIKNADYLEKPLASRYGPTMIRAWGLLLFVIGVGITYDWLTA